MSVSVWLPPEILFDLIQCGSGVFDLTSQTMHIDTHVSSLTLFYSLKKQKKAKQRQNLYIAEYLFVRIESLIFDKFYLCLGIYYL